MLLCFHLPICMCALGRRTNVACFPRCSTSCTARLFLLRGLSAPTLETCSVRMSGMGCTAQAVLFRPRMAAYASRNLGPPNV